MDGFLAPDSVSLSSVLVLQQSVTSNNTYVQMRIGDIPVRIQSARFQNPLNPANGSQDFVSSTQQ